MREWCIANNKHPKLAEAIREYMEDDAFGGAFDEERAAAKKAVDDLIAPAPDGQTPAETSKRTQTFTLAIAEAKDEKTLTDLVDAIREAVGQGDGTAGQGSVLMDAADARAGALMQAVKPKPNKGGKA